MTAPPMNLPLFESGAGPAPAAGPTPAPAPRSRRSRPAPALRPLPSPQPAPRQFHPPRELWLAAHLPDLSRAPERARALLERLAEFAGRFTPRVSIEPPDALLLEVRGSLGLFGGLAPLQRCFEAGCLRIGVRPQLALAPVPLAALAGARSGALFQVQDESQLLTALRPLPLTLLRWPPQALERLAMIGVHTVGGALRLPRAGFARRFGAPQLAALDRLLGRGAEPRSPWQARERFRIRRSFVHERRHHDALLQALAPLVEQLGRFLQARQCGVSALRCRLLHRQGEPSCFELRWVEPEADAARLLDCLGERLATLTLPAPVRGCELATAQLLPRAPVAASLWQVGEHGGGRMRMAPFIEQLRARLGTAAVHGLAVADVHVPEAASRCVALEALQPAGATAPRTMARGANRGEAALGAASRGAAAQGGLRPCPGSPARPLWLLPEPELLAEVAGRPWRGGSLRLRSGPERIETRWGEAEVGRDYYQAIDVHGVRLWIYRERRAPHRWFLHGLAG